MSSIELDMLEHKAVTKLAADLWLELPEWYRNQVDLVDADVAIDICTEVATKRVLKQKQQRLDAEAMARTSDEEYWKSYTEGAHKQ